ncbi:sigma-70 family RNA polymerase sigma factor [Paenalcaligenes niemegkensis]|uniref:RNA polymerase sigma factor n=1 Tax=Paenalcaligenes niemegkensis TaxID=2895469 RepID=UPI001EE88A91|nr:sigma-70 family RNA polymerase sigma factor [Paenalcaligenes niemegkensis]MCQ9616636.1 sigma-70 family RNA polymerase sigma factor [Paenalcaligenes niemegkensis]
MSVSGLGKLRALLTDRYDVLKSQVAKRLGSSSDMAGDALHDAYVRLAVRDDFDKVQYPQTYLVNAAVNGAIDQIRRDVRLVSESEIDGLFELPYEGPGPERTVDGNARLELMVKVLESLPPRRCALLVEYRVHGTGTTELARRWGISKVMVRREIQAAHKSCLEAMSKLEQNNK